MRIVAIDSSGLVASVAILENDSILATYSVNYKKTHSQTLLPMLQEIMQMTEFDKTTIDAIAVAKGPGSFHGAADRFGNSKRAWTCAGKTDHRSTDCGCPCLSAVWYVSDLPDDGCQKAAGLDGLTVSVP